VIYLDYNATTPVDPQVAAAMLPILTEPFGNPSSAHAQGQAARAAIDGARRQVADCLEAPVGGVIFTSGGTEANNHALIGAARKMKDRGRHLVTTAVEHPAVSEVCRFLETEGFHTTYVPVDGTGRVDPADVDAACTDETVLISVMLANNEVGTLQPVAEIARQARMRNILTHSDCAQAVGKIPVSLATLGVDMLSVAGHKLYGPKGIGVLCLRDGLTLPNLMFGAGHEAGRRPGTENILEIVGLARACELVAADVVEDGPRLAALRDGLQRDLLAAFPQARVHGHPDLRLPNTLSIGFPDLEVARIMALMPEVAVSAGAACHGSGSPVISHVLAAMGVPEAYAHGTLRLSLGRPTTDADVAAGLAEIIRAVSAAMG